MYDSIRKHPLLIIIFRICIAPAWSRTLKNRFEICNGPSLRQTFLYVNMVVRCGGRVTDLNRLMRRLEQKKEFSTATKWLKCNKSANCRLNYHHGWVYTCIYIFSRILHLLRVQIDYFHMYDERDTNPQKASRFIFWSHISDNQYWDALCQHEKALVTYMWLLS
jgi:hypothetical protein